MADASMRTLIGLAMCLALGCGAGTASNVQVSGTLKDPAGAAVTGESGMVVFHPVGEGQPASGAVGADGAFTLMTRKPGDGVAPGKYKVVLKIWKSYRDQTSAVAERYGDPATTPLEATVDPANTRFDFVIEP